MQVQGSGRVKLTDGSWVRLGYAARTGTPIRHWQLLAARGQGRPKDLTMEGLKTSLRADRARPGADAGEQVYVFFRECRRKKQATVRSGPKASADARRSLAVDTAYHKLGTPISSMRATLPRRMARRSGG